MSKYAGEPMSDERYREIHRTKIDPEYRLWYFLSEASAHLVGLWPSEKRNNVLHLISDVMHELRKEPDGEEKEDE